MSKLFEKARRAALTARANYAAGDYDGASNRAYYAMFNAVRAVLALDGFDLKRMKRHGTVIRTFSDEYIGRGLIDADLGRKS